MTTEAKVTRRNVGLVGVDAGLMVIGADSFPGEQAIDDIASGDNKNAWWKPTYVMSSSGVGDGCYDVLVVENDSVIVGVEVLFISKAADDLAERLLEESGVTKPTQEQWGSKDDADRAVVRAYLAKSQEFTQVAFEQVAFAAQPASESSPMRLGVLTVASQVMIGDPCYGGPTEVVDVPAGRYSAVAWKAELDTWGNRIFRLGIYRDSNLTPDAEC